LKALTSEKDLEELSKDSGFIVKRPVKGFRAANEEEASEVLREASIGGVSVTPRGAGTSIPSQAVGAGYILLQDGDAVELLSGAAWCDPGLVKSELNRRLDASGIWVPVDPSSYKSCTVGGMTANNSSGSRSFKYGSTVDHVVGLRAIFPDGGLGAVSPVSLDAALGTPGPVGKVARLLVENSRAIGEDAPRVTKNSSGYRLERVIHDGLFDLSKLLVGSEGTLAVFTKVGLATRPKPKIRALAIFEAELEELDEVATHLRTRRPSAIELVDKSIFVETGRSQMIRQYSRSEDQYLVFCEFDGMQESQVQDRLLEVSEDPRLSQYDPLVLLDPAEVSNAWDVRNETLTIAGEMRRGTRRPLPGVEDVVVPPEELGRVIRLLTGSFETRGLQYISYGHAGDANLHMRPLLDPSSEKDLRVLREIMEECFEVVWKLGGSMTGEHGDGLLRAPYVERQYRRTYWIMKEVKRLFDPKGLLNPGVKVA
jgi:FAD/FMN-containing dehydrogenase